MYINIIYFIISLVSTLLVFKVLIENGSYLNLYDHPNDRKIHKQKILKVGGLGVIFSSLLVLLFYRIINEEFLLSVTEPESHILFSTIFLIIGGFFDDLIGINAYQKLFFQLIAISIIVKAGFILSISNFYYMNISITVIFFVIVINSMNLIDGIDGLSSGIFMIFCLSMIVLINIIPIVSQQYFILISIFLGSIFAFFLTNFPPAKIFIGDAGSQLLGWIMALSIVYLSLFFDNNYQKIYLLSFVSLPFYDVFYLMILRFNTPGSFVCKVQSIVSPDQNHIHHALLKNGFSDKKSLFILLVLFLILSLLSLIPIYLSAYYLIVFLFILLLFIFFRFYLVFNLNNSK